MRNKFLNTAIKEVAAMKVVQQMKKQLDIWAVLSFLFIAIILMPNILIAVEFFSESNDNWIHIKEFLLADIIRNTVVILFFTGITTTIIGTSLAWLITAYQFPLRNFLKWGLILPLAIPPFIGAYTYHGILSYTGIIQSTLRNNFDISVNQQYFNIMNIEGTIFIFTLFLFPYIFVITKSFLQNQPSSIIENARLLGGNAFEVFFRVILPISRAAIVGGITIVMLEIINDYGVVKLFGVQTFITAIFQTWFGMGDLDSAFKIAGTLMIVVIFILVFEKIIQGRKRYSYSTSKIKPIQPQLLSGTKKWMAFSYCFGIFAIAFLIPFIQLIYWVFMTFEKIWSVEFFTLIKNSFFVAAVGATVIVVLALIIANYTRLHRGVVSKIISKLSVLGYSIPGAVIAIAVITVFLALDDYIYSLFQSFQAEPSFFFRTSLIVLISAYVIRFLAVGFNSIDAGFEKVGTNFTDASRTLGSSTIGSFFKVDIPMIKGGIMGGFILVFVDILKELPLTMLLQPFNFSTLATKAFVYANDEMVNEAASASVLIILISALCIFVFHKVLDKESS
ncbi:ferric iron ABC transporter [Halalkalibacter akibai JCM 9157]|uniref:Ferric iron ABC transporter n=2 Tax=Halalkalibacter akibai TaxID=1411 RepID=W4QNF1_HALA3|nr:ferric iron ABC transporter [Halalkalibacter akibai JCM 9157]